MAQTPPEGYQRVIPYLVYNDAPAALEFLCDAFGFTQRMQMPNDDGTLLHAEVACEDNVIMLASVPEDAGYASPRDLPNCHASILCYVNDVDAHHEQAKAAGAKIHHEPEDQFYGDRTYRAEDPEGHQWSFHTHVRDVAKEEM